MVVGVTNSNTAKNALVDDFSPRIRPRALAVGSRSLNVWELCGLSDIAQEPYTITRWWCSCLAPSQLRRCSVRCLNYTMLFCSAKNSWVSPPAALFRCNHYWPHKSICLPSPPITLPTVHSHIWISILGPSTTAPAWCKWEQAVAKLVKFLVGHGHGPTG